MNDRNDEIEIDLWELLDLLLHKLWIIIPTAMVTFVIGFCIAMFAVTPMYQSTTGIYVMSRQNSDTLTISDTQLSSQLTRDYEELIQSRTVLESVIAKTGVDDTYGGLKDRVSIRASSISLLLMRALRWRECLQMLLEKKVRSISKR